MRLRDDPRLLTLAPPIDDKGAAEVARALGHPLRLQIMRELRSRKTVSPKELTDALQEPLGNVSYHMSVLRKAGAVEIVELIQRRGAMEHRYALAKTPRAALVNQLLDQLAAS